MNWRNWPLAVKLTVIMTTMVVTIVVAVTLLSIRREQRTFRAELQQQADLLLDTLEAAADDLLYYLDADLLSDIMEGLGEDRAIVSSGRFYDMEGRIVADAYDEDLTYGIETDPFGRRLVESDMTVFEWLPDQLVAGRAVIVAGQRFGAISIGLPTASLKTKLVAVRNQGLSVAIAATIVGIGLALFASRSIINPFITNLIMNSLIHGFESISHGREWTRIKYCVQFSNSAAKRGH